MKFTIKTIIGSNHYGNGVLKKEKYYAIFYKLTENSKWIMFKKFHNKDYIFKTKKEALVEFNIIT